MKPTRIFVALFLGFALVTSGCFKKHNEQANLNMDTGFDSLNGTEELAQLPSGTASNKQGQGAVEVLPIEASPVTQSVNSLAGAGSAIADATAAVGSLNHQQQIQTALKGAGLYDGPIDGRIGPKTKKAIEEFQKQNNLKIDGKVGPKTWAALGKYLSGATADTQSVTTENPEQ